MILWGGRSYLHNGQLYPINRILGWCSNCRNFAGIESLPTQQLIDELQAKLVEKETAILKVKRPLIEKQPWYKRLLKIDPELPLEMRDQESQFVSLRRKLEEEAARFRILTSRRPSARCLDCGSVDVQPAPSDFDHFPDPEKGRRSFAIGFEHPGCGGSIIGKPSGMRISLVLEHRVYDTGGNFLYVAKDD